MIENLLQTEGIEFLSISSRTKNLESAIEKINQKEYSEFKNQITDLSGIRITTYIPSQAQRVSDLVSSTFDIDQENSSDRSDALGTEKVGYRSIHYVCTLGKRRSSLPEYKGISSLKFEIQIRTVLQHAWAELAHDNSFKIHTSLPKAIQRKLNLHAAMLEIVDNAFQEIYDDAQKYKKDLNSKSTDVGKEDINIFSVQHFIDDFSKKNKIGFFKNVEDVVVQELRRFGFSSISELALAIDKNSLALYRKHKIRKLHSPVGFLRAMMMLNDIEKYFSIKGRWSGMNPSTHKMLLERYEPEFVAEILKENRVHVMATENEMAR